MKWLWLIAVVLFFWVGVFFMGRFFAFSDQKTVEPEPPQTEGRNKVVEIFIVSLGCLLFYILSLCEIISDYWKANLPPDYHYRWWWRRRKW
jgi:heme/copper-type cytochrome/quinol oxidase subunit 2